MASLFLSNAKSVLTFFWLAMALVSLCTMASPVVAQDTKVAFIGDQGTEIDARRVLELIRDEGTDLLLIQGDLGYYDNQAQNWIDNIDTILGRDFPVLIVVGNHENYEWPLFKHWQQEKLSRVSDIQCEGDIGVKSFCTYRDFGIVLVSPGIITVPGINGSDNYPEYITEKLGSDNSNWRICSWHKNMRDMQTGDKGNATGWGVYQSCLAQGGLVMTAHEHAYSRTHLMSSFESKTVIHTSREMDIGPNSSIAVVSGLGGHSIRPQKHGGDWFASIYTLTQGATDGALFCNFSGIKGDCYMKDVAGRVPDTFTLTSLRAKALADPAANEEAARLEAEAAEQARLEAAAAEQARLEAAAAEQAALDAAGTAWLQLQAELAEQARLEAEAAEQAALDAAGTAWLLQQAELAEQARLEAEAAEQAALDAAGTAWLLQQAEAAAAAELANQNNSDSPLLSDSPGEQQGQASTSGGASTTGVSTSLADNNTPAADGSTDSADAGNSSGGGALNGFALLALFGIFCARRRAQAI